MNGWISRICFLLLLNSVCTQKSQDLRCGVCRALVDELEWEISQIDPKKTIQVGSFRINPDGSQSIVEVPYARSEAHLTELLENISSIIVLNLLETCCLDHLWEISNLVIV